VQRIVLPGKKAKMNRIILVMGIKQTDRQTDRQTDGWTDGWIAAFTLWW